MRSIAKLIVKSFKGIIALTVLMASSRVLAIGAGGIVVDSYLNEPLDADDDPAETAIDLARAYLDMGDKAGAQDLLKTAISMGDPSQIETAKELLSSIEQ